VDDKDKPPVMGVILIMDGVMVVLIVICVIISNL